MSLYLDTSAFLKLLFHEEHSDAVRSAAGNADIWSSVLLRAEAHRAALRAGVDPSEVDVRLRRITTIDLTDSMLLTARSLRPAVLRTLDALHLATALAMGRDLDAVVAYDRRLAAACELLGVTVAAPGLEGRWWESA